MVDLGFFAQERVELIDGLLVTMSPQGSRHANIVARLATRLLPALLDHAEVRIQSPFAAGGDSEPEPDIAVVPLADYWRNHPANAFLIVEVSDSTLAKDRSIKTRLYARAGIAEYWIVDLEANVVEVRRQPQGDGYLDVTRHGRGERLSLLAFPDVSVETDQILPVG
jgi:Uma2 family endonuclease